MLCLFTASVAHACLLFQATKMFVSNLNARLAQRFLALVLLPRVRREIQDNQKLHFALFMALKKATYKPGAFYKVSCCSESRTRRVGTQAESPTVWLGARPPQCGLCLLI